jgi:hypothetical protein
VSRSTTRAPKPARTNVCRKMSRIAVRESTSDRPSIVSSSPAMTPKRVDRSIRCTMRVISTTATTPAIAGATRQPSELLPQIDEVRPISHLPRGGCTMNM